MSSYPYTWTPISEEEKEERRQMYEQQSIMTDVVRCDQMEVLMPQVFADENMGQRIWDMKPRPDDIWIATYPKCGTTMTQELVWQMINLAKGGQLDSDKSKEFLFLRVPFIEFSSLLKGVNFVPATAPGSPDTADRIQKMFEDNIAYTESLEDSPRLIKTHLPISMLPPDVIKTSKILVVARNPKDACASFFHHERLLPMHCLKHSFPFDDYAKMYMQGKVPYGDYWTFLKDAMKYQHHESVKIVWYEDVKKDIVAKIKDIGDFIGFHVPEPKIESLVNHMRIDNFKKNDAVNLKPAAGTVPEHVRDNHSFIRKGIVGDGKGHFVSPAVEEKFDNWVRKNNKDDEGNVIENTVV